MLEMINRKNAYFPPNASGMYFHSFQITSNKWKFSEIQEILCANSGYTGYLFLSFFFFFLVALRIAVEQGAIQLVTTTRFISEAITRIRASINPTSDRFPDFLSKSKFISKALIQLKTKEKYFYKNLLIFIRYFVLIL